MSPTVFRYKNYRFLFFSREELRMHIHVQCEDGEAKFWMEPEVELAMSSGLKSHQISEVGKIIEEKADEIRESWNRHFGSRGD